MKLRKLNEDENKVLKLTARRIGKLILLVAIIKGIRWWLRANSDWLAGQIDTIQRESGITLEQIIYASTTAGIITGIVFLIAGFMLFGLKFLEKKAFTVIVFGFIIDMVFVRLFPDILAAIVRAVTGVH
ncbi:hypothetical protein FT641_19690 [Bacillus paranthracis]|uniref:hypothetical protein n=1 Tax=Bacillus paranthracis TaxID=2026186 RepID=UPI0018791010|nr:hypothetical protein [Bacillus paranthracis]MBE7114716.1 hypothetical protein [Bacillus paranthracis]MBE7154917.1 hypothetical protein [Bacillus paranthracis]